MLISGKGQKRLATALCALVFAVLACNAPLGLREEAATATPEPTETATETNKATLEPAQTAAPAIDTATAGKPTETPEPSATTAQPTLAPTHTAAPSHTPRPSHTPGPTSTRVAGHTATPEPTTGNDGPLSFTYQISWRLKNEGATQAIATVTIFATGGGGDYEYFRDEQQVDGSVFEYEWRTCQGNPGSLRVDSADGQSVRTDYFENPPCPTPTPQS